MRYSYAGSTAVVTVIISLLAFSPSGAGPIYTTNLFVQLDGTNLGADGSAISSWVDQKTDEDGTATDNHQDFGQTTTAKQPTARLMTMPNGSIQKVVEFNRGLAGSSANSSSTTSDFLQSSTGGLGAAFGGADTAWESGGTAGDDGMSYFIVYKSRVVTTSGPNASQSQTPLNVAYSNGSNWGTAYTTAAGGTIATRPDLFNACAIREHSKSTSLFGDVAATASWYISGVSWNLDTGVTYSTILQEDQAIKNETLNSGVFTASNGTHTSTFLGAGTTATTNGRHLDGWIAEVLVYKGALSQDDMNSVVQYLDVKYLIPEPWSFELVSVAGIGLMLVARRRA